ncbi:Lpg1974 family pore-forming outer membrane protein [Legionella sp.]|uniref:Lpg1974 family pore-forming outer membrane protein n=1 Tax=Legionella sp. TaxID=459 RepID=UPI003220110C
MGPEILPQTHWDGGVNIQVIQPFFQNNPAFYFLNDRRDSVTEAFFQVSDIQNQRDVYHHMDLAPEFFLGYTFDNGIGFHTRFWFFNQNTKQSVGTPVTSVTDLTLSFPVSSAAPIGLDIDTRDNNLPDGMTVTTKLKTQIWDGIVSKSYDLSSSILSIGAGARYAYMSQKYNAFESQAPGATLDIRMTPPAPQFITEHKKTLRSGHNFNGWGPVVQLNDQVFLGQSGFSLVGTLRGAVLFGPSKQNAYKNLLVRGTQYGSQILSETAFVQRSNHHQTTIEIVDVEAGVEYSKSLFGGEVSAQLLGVAQEWFGGGSASKSATTGAGFGLPGSGMTGAPQVAGVTSESNFGFLGAAFKLGFCY